jgi:hypothetical protein
MQNNAAIYTVQYKSILTYNTETQTLTKRIKSKIQIMHMKRFLSIDGKTRRDKTGN